MSGIDPTLEEFLLHLPEVQAGIGLWQNAYHDYDVYGHTIQFVHFLKQMTGDIEMIVAGYLHDIGKNMVKKVKMGEGTIMEKEPGKPYHEFGGHEKAGEDFVLNMPEDLFVKYGLDQKRVARLVGTHYLPLEYVKLMRKAVDYVGFKDSYNSLEHALDGSGVSRADVMTMFLADSLAKGKGCTDWEELMLVRDAILSGGEEPLLRRLYDLQRTK